MKSKNPNFFEAIIPLIGYLNNLSSKKKQTIPMQKNNQFELGLYILDQVSRATKDPAILNTIAAGLQDAAINDNTANPGSTLLFNKHSEKILKQYSQISN